MSAEQILKDLTQAYAKRDLLNIDHSNARDAATPEEVKTALAEVDQEFSPMLEAIADVIEKLEAQAKEAVLAEGKTVKGGALQAVYSAGRVTWNSDMLDGMIALVPDIAKARKEGKPSITIRKAGA